MSSKLGTNNAAADDDDDDDDDDGVFLYVLKVSKRIQCELEAIRKCY